MDNKITKICYTALFLAAVCVTTIAVRIPSPARGYINLGDCAVILSGWLLGPWYGFLAAGLGSAAADILSGYTHYAAPTFIIKGLMAVIACGIRRLLVKKDKKRNIAAEIFSGAAAGLFMTAGYFFAAAVFLSQRTAAVSEIPANLIQGAFGVISATAVHGIIIRLKLVKIR